MWRAAPAGIRTPASAADRAEGRASGQDDPVGVDRAVVRLDPGDPPAAICRGRRAEGPEGGPLTQLHARGPHRERVRSDVPWRVDGPVAGGVAPAAMADGRQGHGRRRGLGGVEPGDIEPRRLLHADPLTTGPLVVLGHRQDQVAELAEAGIGAVRGRLAAIEVDRPATERHRRRCPALGPDDAGRTRRGTHPDQATLEDDHPARAVGRGEDRRPAADRPRPDDHQVRAVSHRSLRVV